MICSDLMGVQGRVEFVCTAWQAWGLEPIQVRRAVRGGGRTPLIAGAALIPGAIKSLRYARLRDLGGSHPSFHQHPTGCLQRPGQPEMAKIGGHGHPNLPWHRLFLLRHHHRLRLWIAIFDRLFAPVSVFL